MGLSFAFFTSLMRDFQGREQTFQAARRKGWTTSLQEFRSSLVCGDPGVRDGDMLIDAGGRIWAAGNCQLTGVHFYAGAGWTSHQGVSTDLALTPDGQVLVAGDSLLVFDGQKWITYGSGELGLGDQQILQVEVDRNGRIWIVTNNFGVEEVAEVVVQQNKATARFPHPEFTIRDGQIYSLDADNQGRLWAAVWSYEGPDAVQEKWAGLDVFDGETWQRVPDQGRDLQHVVRTAFDKQGRAWVATQCGGVMTYDGKDWATVVDEDTSPDCGYGPRVVNGILLDDQGRVWTWGMDKVQLLHDDAWMILTTENSGFDGRVFGLVVDRQDRVWVGTTEGVTMAALQDAQPLPEKIVQQERTRLLLQERLGGMDWFLPSIFGVLWIAAFLNVLPGALIALALGALALLGFGGPLIGQGYSQYLNPGVVATYGGMLGGILGGLIDKRRRAPGRSRWAFVLGIAGAILGFGIAFVFALLANSG
jgi:ligand-binding sensor domain-containing protein